MTKALFALILSAGMLAACTAETDGTAVLEKENEMVEVTKEQASSEVSAEGEEEQDLPVDDADGEVDSNKETAPQENVFYQPDILDEDFTDEQWTDVNSTAYQLPDHLQQAPDFASLEEFLITLHESWQAESPFREEAANKQFEEDAGLAMATNTYLNYYKEEAAQLGIGQEVQALKEAAFNLHRNFYGTHQEKLNDSLRMEFEEHLNYLLSLLDNK